MKTLSITKARRRLSKAIRTVEKEGAIQLTCDDKVVAVLLSPREYGRLQKPLCCFWDAYCEFRQRLERQALDLDPEQVFANVSARKQLGEKLLGE